MVGTIEPAKYIRVLPAAISSEVWKRIEFNVRGEGRYSIAADGVASGHLKRYKGKGGIPDMPTLHPQNRKCVACGMTSQHSILVGTIASGSTDLDSWPPYMDRMTIDAWVQRCPFCGYCDRDISMGRPEVTGIIQSDAYQAQLHSADFPALANAFLCCSQIQEHFGELVDAGWVAVFAAWACDDAAADTAAQNCRKRATVLLQRAKEVGQRFSAEIGGEEAIMADLLRRSGQFELALRFCEEGLKKNPQRIISRVVRFQKLLISQSDVACHRASEATQSSPRMAETRHNVKE